MKKKLEFKTEIEDVEAFVKVEDMTTGSSETFTYCVVASHNSDFVMKYHMAIRDNEEFQKLAEILITQQYSLIKE